MQDTESPGAFDVFPEITHAKIKAIMYVDKQNWIKFVS